MASYKVKVRFMVMINGRCEDEKIEYVQYHFINERIGPNTKP